MENGYCPDVSTMYWVYSGSGTSLSVLVGYKHNLQCYSLMSSMIARWGCENKANPTRWNLFVAPSNWLLHGTVGAERCSDDPNQQKIPCRSQLRACQLRFSIGMPRSWNIFWYSWCKEIKKKKKSCLCSSYVSVWQCWCYTKKLEPKLSILAVLFIKIR